VIATALSSPGAALDDDSMANALTDAFEQAVAGERVLVLVPDHTRRLPTARLLTILGEALHRARSLDVIVANGTHPPLTIDVLQELSPKLPIRNHDWRDEGTLVSLGSIASERIRDIAGPIWHESLDRDLDIRINRAARDADRVIIMGPTLPHEVAGFSGGAKYLFPGISGPEMIDVMHWLGALSGVLATIGVADTPVRALIGEAAGLLPSEVSLVACVTRGEDMAGLFAGPEGEAWSASVGLAAEHHIMRVEHPYRRVISRPLPIYDELWVAAKAIYKLEPVVADGGELIVHAPGLNTVSQTHGTRIFEVGYHVLPYFLAQWERFRDVPLAVLAHSTHVKGAGEYATDGERPRITVALATGIGPKDCERLNLKWVDPASVEELSRGDDVLVVPDAGEVLYRPAGPEEARTPAK
jgi:nickel-dependent lactate racemase